MKRRRVYLLAPVLLTGILAAVLAIAPTIVFASSSFIEPFNTVSTIASTVPGNGDINPYGVAVVPSTIGSLVKGNILVSNFNNCANQQGTGTTIVQVTPDGSSVSVFAQLTAGALHGSCPGGVGLTTALVALQRGWVIVGSLPTADGTAATAKAGCLIVMNSNGKPVETFTGSGINGPWDMTAFDGGNWADLFVTNVLNGTVAANGNVVNRGTVLRINLDVPRQGQDKPNINEITIIGSGFPQRTDPSALVIGPTGVGLGSNNTLYVANSLNNSIAAIPNALTRDSTAFTGKDVSAGGALNDPLGLAIAPNGNILTANGNDGNLVETTPGGTQFAPKLIDSTGNPPGSGCLFGIGIVPGGSGVYFVDDCSNTLNLLS